MPSPSLRAAIDGKCRACIHDPLSAGTWREQVAACVSANCDLHPVRPLPRAVLQGGRIDAEALRTLRDRLDTLNRSQCL